jgi:hypothetical protein
VRLFIWNLDAEAVRARRILEALADYVEED